jgi:diguanylate cyclase (GGDEF)-like protein/PAS domain S-box-containing protein
MRLAMSCGRAVVILHAFRQRRGEAGSVESAEPLRDLLSFREPRDAVSAAIRRAQIDALIRLVPVTVTSQLLAAVLVAVSLYGHVPAIQLGAWLVGMFGICIARGGRAMRVRIDPAYAERKPPRLKHIVIIVGLLGLLWLVPPIFWFGLVDFDEKLLLCMLAVGLMSGATVSLASVPQAAIPYVALMCGGGVLMAAQFQDPVQMVMLQLLFAWVLSWAIVLNARRFINHVRGQLELHEQSELIRLLREFEASGSDWLWEVGPDYRLLYMSKAMADAFGMPLRDLIGKPAIEILDPDGKAAPLSVGLRILESHAREKKAFKDVAIPVQYGRRWWLLSGKPLIDSAGRFLGWRGVGSDITDVRLTGTDSIRTARLDPLTGVANRLLVREQLEGALLRCLDEDAGCALLLVDLDRFKLVNDTLGHGVGDDLLCEVAKRLEQSAGGVGTVGRLGGDEFALVWDLPACRETLSEIADRIIADVSRPFAIAGTTIHVGATVGIARAPEDGGNEEELIRSADLALYRAKAQGRGSHQFFARWMADEAIASRRLESDLRSALAEGGLSLAYQPIVDARSGAIVAREALMRWTHPEYGEIEPDTFVPIIEEAGLIGQVGAWVLREACAEAATWDGDVGVAVNLSPVQLGSSGLEATVVNALASTGLKAGRLELEVTESVFLSDDPSTRKALARLHSLGIRLVLDDFGTGYSSFGSLARGEFSKIKIDRTFASGAAAGDPQARSIVEAMIGLAGGLGLKVTAEGVETAHEAKVLTELGCDQLQGFYFGRPERSALPPRSELLPDHTGLKQRPERRRLGGRS